MAQSDSDSNGIGDACECYANISGPSGTPDSKVDAFDSLKITLALLCRGGCTPESCPADLNKDGKVDSLDCLILKVQFNQTGCQLPQEN